MFRNDAARGPAIPLPAATWGYNRLAFDYEANIDGLGAIDTTNSKAGGFKWYVNNAWPNVPASTNWSTYPSTHAADLSVSGDVLTIATDRGNFAQCLNTAAALSGSNRVGTVFSPGWYFECKFSSAVPTVGSGTWPSIWSEAIEFETGQVTSGNRFDELDFMEVISGAAIASIHSWLYNGTYVDQLHNGSMATADTAYHTVGGLWVPTTQNGGTGLWQAFWDGTHIGALDFTYTSSDNYYVGESQHFSLLLGAGHNATDGDLALNVKHVRLWQT